MQIPESVCGIMQRHGARCSPAEFLASINLIFHEFESEVYDDAHAHMWEILPPQFSLLVDDCLQCPPGLPPEIRLLDIGCGTGLAADCILQTAIRPRIKSVDLLDTSPNMLRRALGRISGRDVPTESHLGTIESLPAEKRYEVIVTSSVLHHIPDLPEFLAAVRSIQAAGGVFLHLHDPNGDANQDAELRERRALASRRLLPDWASRFSPGRIVGRIVRELTGRRGQDYISKTNRALVEKGILVTPLSSDEIYAITDIHAQEGTGIAVSRMKAWMPDYECISQRSYGFFGKSSNELSPRYRKLEEDLIRQRASNGSKIGAAWRLRQSEDA
jgi:SAM-dependent methyltransferase